MDYRDEIEAIIEREHRIIGDVAYTKANELDFLTVRGDGTIEYDEEEVGWESVEVLIEKFAKLQGPRAAMGIAKRATDEVTARGSTG